MAYVSQLHRRDLPVGVPLRTPNSPKKLALLVFVEEIPGTKFSNKVDNNYWENLKCFKLSVLSTRSVIMKLLQFIGKEFQILIKRVHMVG